MSKKITEIVAKDADHLNALKGVLTTAFKDTVKIHDLLTAKDFGEDSIIVTAVKPAGKPTKGALTKKQEKTLKALGYKVRNGIATGG